MTKFTFTQPERKMTTFKPTGESKKLLENPYYEKRVDGPMRLVPLATGQAITKDYGSYEMIYSRAEKFGKYVNGEGRVTPSRRDIRLFRVAINNVAQRDPEIRDFIDRNPDLKIESGQL